MKTSSIKFKVTLWYTFIILLLFGIVLISAFASSELHSESSIKEQLLDEVGDTYEQCIENFSAVFDDNFISYDDGVMLSVYDENHILIAGVFPDNASIDVPFVDKELQEIRDINDNWFIYDMKAVIDEDTTVWIRGTSTISPLVSMVHQMMLILSFIVPPLAVLTAFISYRMIGRSLRPISSMSKTVTQIINSTDLSLRLEKPSAKDEFYELTETFNHMLEHLEQQFIREQQFSSDAAHELRTPIASILSHCEYCLDEVELNDEARKELNAIREKAFQMSSLVSTLLTIARAENNRYLPDFEEVDLSILAESVVEELTEKALTKNITITLEDTMINPVVTGDMAMLTRLFINLIDNAIAYGNNNGNVKVSIFTNNDTTVIEIEDDGIGIPEEALNKIWNRFYQVDSSHSSSGFGLGLFLVRYIVNCHKGTIDVKSKLGEGTTFTIVLPPI